MIKQIKLLTILGSVAILGGVSTFAVLGTSCEKGRNYDKNISANDLQEEDTVKNIKFLSATKTQFA
jgi:hypothetical protein